MFEPPTSTILNSNPKKTLPAKLKFVVIFLLVFVLLSVTFQIFFKLVFSTPSTTFPSGVSVVIEEGMSAKAATKLLAEQGFVQYETALYLALVLYYDQSSVKAGTYIFNAPLTAREVAEKITTGNNVNDLVKITHIEGERVTLLAERIALLLPEFDSARFIMLATPEEGKLFPDTYLVPKDFTADDLFILLTEAFASNIASLQTEIDNHSLSINDIITLASILEREANTTESRKIVSGILQKRLAIGMALQVDASMEYVLEKELSQLTPEDLKRDSPYNTYLYPGLPPTPIGNPGLEAIKAVLEPTPSEYLFYITGNDGEFYYAKNFDQHRLNIARHLR